MEEYVENDGPDAVTDKLSHTFVSSAPHRISESNSQF